jgi:hypothetical protein
LENKQNKLNKKPVISFVELKPITILDTNEYNPKEFNSDPDGARFFVIKSYSEEDIHRSIKYNIWCSTEHGNRRLDTAFAQCRREVPIYLFFSVNGSRHFCGMAEMISGVDYNQKTDIWSQDKWRGCLKVKWIYVKDVPNAVLRNIRLENNEDKPVTNSRDTQEIPFEKGKLVLKVFHSFQHSSSIFDDFKLYDQKEDENQYKNVFRKSSHQNIFNQVENREHSVTEQMSNSLTSEDCIHTNTTENEGNVEQSISSGCAMTSSSIITSSMTSSPSSSSASSSSSAEEESKSQNNKCIDESSHQQEISVSN